jgi:hypothetical protein
MIDELTVNVAAVAVELAKVAELADFVVAAVVVVVVVAVATSEEDGAGS